MSNQKFKPQVRVGVGVIILKDKQVLLLKRKGSHGDGTWSFPGGHLEFNESVEECAKREVLEETGINMRNLKMGTFTNDIFPQEEKHYITLYVIAEYESGEARILEPEKCEAIEWFNWGHLPSPLFIPLQNLLKQNYSPF